MLKERRKKMEGMNWTGNGFARPLDGVVISIVESFDLQPN